MRSVFLAAAALMSVTPVAAAENPPAAPPVMNEDVGVPVFPYDITDRPYKVLGEVNAGVRKATVFSKSPSQEKIYKELWERAQKLGADAVVNAKYGDAHMTAMSWGSSKASGTAIKFLPAGSTASGGGSATKP